MAQANPFLSTEERIAWGPGSMEMALPLVETLNLGAGMRVLEVGGGSGQIASILAREWDVSVVTLEPWAGGAKIQARAVDYGVANRVLALKQTIEGNPFADETFDAVLSVGSFEMIGDREGALREMIRVARPGARIGIAEPMCLPDPIPPELAELDERGTLRFQQCFRSMNWNRDLFERAGLRIVESYYFPEARQWWLEYGKTARLAERAIERELIERDEGRWISLGLVTGEKGSPP